MIILANGVLVTRRIIDKDAPGAVSVNMMIDSSVSHLCALCRPLPSGNLYAFWYTLLYLIPPLLPILSNGSTAVIQMSNDPAIPNNVSICHGIKSTHRAECAELSFAMSRASVSSATVTTYESGIDVVGTAQQHSTMAKELIAEDNW
ncbi:hypothetical protein TNCV_84561 [Trichonephila clavipes]|nr:hypothetical protein TNCV_84561 [Trichonephila clavipes]